MPKTKYVELGTTIGKYFRFRALQKALWSKIFFGGLSGLSFRRWTAGRVCVCVKCVNMYMYMYVYIYIYTYTHLHVNMRMYVCAQASEGRKGAQQT